MFCSRGNQPEQLLSGCRPLQEPLQYCDKGMKNTRTPQQKVVEIPEEAISKPASSTLNLRDMKGNTRKLSELKGKAVIVGLHCLSECRFCHTQLYVATLYDKYAAQGLEIYQVFSGYEASTDTDNLPTIYLGFVQWNFIRL